MATPAPRIIFWVFHGMLHARAKWAALDRLGQSSSFAGQAPSCYSCTTWAAYIPFHILHGPHSLVSLAVPGSAPMPKLGRVTRLSQASTFSSTRLILVAQVRQPTSQATTHMARTSQTRLLPREAHPCGSGPHRTGSAGPPGLQGGPGPGGSCGACRARVPATSVCGGVQRWGTPRGPWRTGPGRPGGAACAGAGPAAAPASTAGL